VKIPFGVAITEQNRFGKKIRVTTKT